MSKAEHTAGPWNTGGVMTRVEVLPKGWNMPMCIADCHAKHAPGSESERVANARLIAAAPDLLEACHFAERIERDTLAELRHDGWGEESMPIAAAKERLATYSAAIAKAEGRL